jgi:hypothetical protein
MRTVILTAVILTMTLSLTAQVNKFVFSSGMEFGMWNKDVIRGTMIYFNNPMDENYEIYMEAVHTVESMGGDFNTPDVEESVSDGAETWTDIVYERRASASNSYLKRAYYLNGKTVTVVISKAMSFIRID